MSTQYSIEQMNQLSNALDAAGFLENDVALMAASLRGLHDFRNVVRGKGRVVLPKYFVRPIPLPKKKDRCHTLISHARGKRFEWDPAKVELYSPTRLGEGTRINGHLFLRELVDRRPFNHDMLSLLWKNQEIIPEEWKEKCVGFWGTVWQTKDFHQDFVRALVWRGSRYGWNVVVLTLDDSVSDLDVAVVPINNV